MDLIKRSVIFLFSAGILVYLGFLFSQETVIISQGLDSYWNITMYGIYALICMYIMLFYALVPRHIKKGKIILVIMGLVFLITGNQVLTNNIETHLYVGDIITVLGVILTLVGATNLMVLKKVKQQKEEAEVEVIEV